MSESFKNLKIWQDSVEITVCLYDLTRKFPKSEIFGLVSQIRRASVSIPSNIAEGSSRKSKKDFSRFIEISIGSLYEIESLLNLSYRLKYVSKADFDDINVRLARLGTLIGGFRNYLSK